jgi:hypothetical protein
MLFNTVWLSLLLGVRALAGCAETHDISDAAAYLLFIATSGQGPDVSHRTRLGEALGLPLSWRLLALQLSSAQLYGLIYL